MKRGGIAYPHEKIQGPISYKCFDESPADPNCSAHYNEENDKHATLIMGIIAGDANIPDPYRMLLRGVAHNVCRPLLSVSFIGSLPQATEWALTHWATVFNLSFGHNNCGDMMLEDLFLDAIARNYHRTVIVAAGNDTPGETGNPHECRAGILGDCYVKGGANGFVGSPGLGWNVITVGGFADQDTITWEDDQFYACSSYLNPESDNGDRQKPEVVAPAFHIFGPSINNGYIGMNGTSFAAPHVTGAAALLISKSPSLEAWPEEVAAILMASAIHNVIGDPNTLLHDKDGVGAIDIASAKNVIDNGLNSHHIFTANDLPYDKSFYVTEGEKVRAVIRWNSQTTYDHDRPLDSTSSLEADLALIAYGPNDPNTPLMCSDSYDNNYEIVGFDADETGYYKIRITSYRGFECENEYVGLAICKY